MPPNNILPSHGNEKTMNLNTMILTNIQASPYFKVQLYELKTYHQVIDEIYTRVTHLEPWEKGSRKTAGQTGMCGGVRGVGAGGIVSSCFCLLYKLYTLKLTRKQLVGIMTHTDSPYIRGIGFMYARFSQPPGDLWDWFEPYLDDEEEIDVKAGGGHVMTIGEMVHHFLTKLEWYSTLFPRIPVPIQKQIEQNLLARKHAKAKQLPVIKQPSGPTSQEDIPDREREREPTQQYSRERRELPYDSREVDRIYGRTATERDDTRDREHHGSRSRVDDRRRSRSPGHHRSSHHSKSDRERDRDKHRSRSVDKHSRHDHRRSAERDSRHDDRKRSAERDLKQHADRRSRSRSHHHHSRSRSRSRDKHRSSKKHSSQPHHQTSDEYQQDLHRELERIRKSRSHDHNGR